MTITMRPTSTSRAPSASEAPPDPAPLKRWNAVRIAQSIGALIITLISLVLLFGVPARLLFGIFFD